MILTDAGDSGPGFGLDLDAVDLPARREALVALSRPVTGVHDRAKRLPPALVAQAFANEPFEDHPRTVWAYRRLCETGGEAKERFENSYRQGTASFLRRIFPSLTTDSPGSPLRSGRSRNGRNGGPLTKPSPATAPPISKVRPGS